LEKETEMAHVVVLGAGLGGAIMAYELKDQLRPEDTVTVVTKDPKYHFVPSNPWIAVGWRDREDITVDLAPTMAKKGIGFIPVAAEKLVPDENRILLVDGKSVHYDYLVIATGPELAFDLPHRPCRSDEGRLRQAGCQSRTRDHRGRARRQLLWPSL
jgi:sulfide:quinone oxidoreductase